MEPVDILYYALSAAVIIFIILMLVVSFFVVRLLVYLRVVAKTFFEIAASLQLIRSGFKFGLFSFLERILRNFRIGR
jgi:hypothetical protein